MHCQNTLYHLQHIVPASLLLWVRQNGRGQTTTLENLEAKKNTKIQARKKSRNVDRLRSRSKCIFTQAARGLDVWINTTVSCSAGRRIMSELPALDTHHMPASTSRTVCQATVCAHCQVTGCEQHKKPNQNCFFGSRQKNRRTNALHAPGRAAGAFFICFFRFAKWLRRLPEPEGPRKSLNKHKELSV